MKQIVIEPAETIGRWVAVRTGGSWSPGRGQGIALTEDDQIIAAVLYEDYNGVNVNVHIAAEPGKLWTLNRAYMHYIFFYPFCQLHCRRLTAVVASDNFTSKEFVTHLGFTLEATLKDAHPNGDLLLFVMRKEGCRWLKLKETENG